MYELIILGAGPAGMTAAIYAARKKVKTLVISKNIGGQVAVSWDVDNYTGFQHIPGPELSKKFEEHLNEFKDDIEIKIGEEIKDIKQLKNSFKIITNKNTYETKTIIIATGKKPRHLNIPGEKEFYNKGVTYCATCDAPIFKDKVVAVIGGGNAALESALQLERIAKKVYLITINPKMKGDTVLIDKIKASKKIELITNTTTKQIIGDKFVKGIKVETNKKEKTLDVQGIFVEIGSIPEVGFAKIIKKNKWNEIMITRSTKSMHENYTSIPGIFAAGDVTDIPEKQVIVAAGEGCKAALAAFDYLAKNF